MKKYLFGAAFSLALLASPAFTQAAGLTSAQINAIISLLQSFGADSVVVARVNSALTGDASVAVVLPPPVSASTSPSVVTGGQSGGSGGAKPGIGVAGKHRVCGILQKNLSQGMRGDEVRSLQEFLGEEGQLSTDAATGYFGPMTARAVAKWQVAQGVQGVGSVGPMTRERIKVWCGKVPPPGVTKCIPRPACLDATPRCLPPEPAGGWCPAPPPLSKKPAVCPEIYMPVCGQWQPSCPAGVNCPASMPAPKTYPSRCVLDAAGATFLYSGQCANDLSAASSTVSNN